MPLSVKDGMGAWVDDFKKSDAPQFKGKSEKERREMAIAAYMSAKKGDSKDEGYVSHAQRKAVWANRADDGKGHPDKKNEATDNPPFTPDPPKQAPKNSDGSKTSPMSRAKQLAKMARDRNVKNEATVDTADIASKKAMKKSDTEKLGKLADMLAKERKPQKESVEHLDEAHAYAKAAKALHDYGTKNGGIDKKDFHTAAKHLDNVGKSGLMQKGNHLAKFNNHLKYLDTDVRDRIHMTLKQHGVMEGTQLDELSPATHKSYQAKAFTSGAAGIAAKRMGTMSAKDAYDNEKKRHTGIELSKSLQRRDDRKKRNEEVEEAGSPERYKMIKKAGDKYNKEKKKAERDAKKAMSKDKDMMGEATYGTQAQRLMSPLQKARQDKEKADRDRDGKLKKEETVSELKKSTLGSYVNKASRDAASKAYGAASAAKDNRADQSGKDFAKSLKRLRGINTATKKLANESTLLDIDHTDPDFKGLLKKHNVKHKVVRTHDTGYSDIKLHGHPDDIKKVKKTMNYEESVKEAKSFDQKFRDHLKFSMSKSPAVQSYLKKRRADRDAAHAKQDPAAVKKNYGPAVVPPGTAYNKASKRGMNPSQAANAVSTAFKNRAKGRKLPEGKIEEAVQFKVDVEGLPPTFMNGKSVGEILANLRKIVKQPSMIKSVDRVTKMDVKTAYRKKAQGREVDEAVDASDTGGKEEVSMAVNQVKQIRHYIDRIETMVKSDGDMEEWVQNKLTKATDYLKTIYGYKTGKSDTNEAVKVNEISKDLRDRYKEKAKSDQAHQQFSADIAKEMGAKDSEKYYRKKQRNRTAGLAMVKRRENG